MNNCFEEYKIPAFRNRRNVASYSRRTRSHSFFSDMYESMINICENVVAFFESPIVRILIKILFGSASFVGFILLVCAVDAGSITFSTGLLSAIAIVVGFGITLKS